MSHKETRSVFRVESERNRATQRLWCCGDGKKLEGGSLLGTIGCPMETSLRASRDDDGREECRKIFGDDFSVFS